MKTKNYLSFLLLAIVFLCFLSPIISAEIQTLGTAKQNVCIDLKQSYYNSTFTNITGIQYPNKTSLAVNYKMTRDNFGNYNYTFCGTQDLGEYIVTTTTDVDGINTNVQYNFQITPTGDNNNLGFYIMITIIIIGILIFGVATRNIPITLIGGMITMAWGVYIGFNGFDVFKNSATEVLSVGIVALGAVWVGIAGLEYFDVI